MAQGMGQGQGMDQAKVAQVVGTVEEDDLVVHWEEIAVDVVVR